MANKRNGARDALYNKQTTSSTPVENKKVSNEIPLFAEESLCNTENFEEVKDVQQGAENAGSEILKEIQEVMAEGAYYTEETTENEDKEETDEKIFVTNAIPLANRDESQKKTSKKELGKDQLTKKAKKEAKKAAYKKTTLKHKLYVISILFVLGIFTGSGLGVWYFNGFLKSNVDYTQHGKPEDYVQSIDDTLTRNFSGINLGAKEDWVDYAKTQGKTPADLSPVDNFVLSQYNMAIANSYSVIGSGSVVAQTIITVDQFLYSEKKFDGQNYSFISISPDTTGLVGDVAVCDVLGKNSKTIKSYKGSINPGNTSAEWAYNTSYTTEEHSNLNGVKVNDIQPYLICTETVVSSSEITINEDGNYVFSLELDTIKSVLNYIRQVKRTGGLATFPEFKSINISFTITPDWQLVKMNIVEVYKAVKMGMTPTITGTLNFDFTVNQPIIMPNLPQND